MGGADAGRLRTQGDLLHLAHVILHCGRTGRLINQLPLGRNDDVGRNRLDGKLIRQRFALVVIQFDSDVLRGDLRPECGIGEDFLIQSHAGLTPRGPKVQQHQAVGLGRQPLGRFNVDFPTKSGRWRRLLRQAGRGQCQYNEACSAKPSDGEHWQNLSPGSSVKNDELAIFIGPHAPGNSVKV